MAVDVEARINQFRNMAEADPDNELGHFGGTRCPYHQSMPDPGLLIEK